MFKSMHWTIMVVFSVKFFQLKTVKCYAKNAGLVQKVY